MPPTRKWVNLLTGCGSFERWTSNGSRLCTVHFRCAEQCKCFHCCSVTCAIRVSDRASSRELSAHTAGRYRVRGWRCQGVPCARRQSGVRFLRSQQTKRCARLRVKGKNETKRRWGGAELMANWRSALCNEGSTRPESQGPDQEVRAEAVGNSYCKPPLEHGTCQQHSIEH